MTPEQMQASVVANLQAKTGKTLQEWIAVLAGSGLSGHKERVDWLKREHGLGDVQAKMVVYNADNPGGVTAKSPEQLLNEQYAGRKEPLRPITERLRAEALSLGDDVSAEVRTTYLSFVRNRSFAVVQPSSATRVDLGLALPAPPRSDRLLPAGNVGSDRIVARTPLENLDDVDGEVLGWLRLAYEQDA
jgi:hypothetical protein